MQVREMMSKDIEVVDRNDTLLAVEERMATKQLRHLPVLEQGDIVGIVTQRDLFKATMSSTMGYGEKAQQAYLQSVRVERDHDLSCGHDRPGHLYRGSGGDDHHQRHWLSARRRWHNARRDDHQNGSPALPHSAGCGVRRERHPLTHARTTPRLVLWDGKAAHHPG